VQNKRWVILAAQDKTELILVDATEHKHSSTWSISVTMQQLNAALLPDSLLKYCLLRRLSVKATFNIFGTCGEHIHIFIKDNNKWILQKKP